MTEKGWKENNIGWDLLNGIGCEKNEEEAKKWFELAAEKGSTRAMVNLGSVYEDSGDYELAYKWYLEAACGGDETGMSNVANMYHWGRYVERDFAKAYRYFKELYEKYRDPKACFYMGLYAAKGYLTEPDPARAAEYYQEGVDRGDPYCATNLGEMYSNGEGVPKDEEKAFRLYLRSIELAEADRTNYENGYGLGYANVGYCYEVGQGVEKDLAKAVEYYKKGVALGEEHCIEQLRKLREAAPGRSVKGSEGRK